MIITSIKQQVRLRGRYSIYVDGAYSFSLSDTALLDSHLYTGFEIEKDALENYKQLATEDKYYALTFTYVVRRMRSRYELNEYFRRKGYNENLSAKLFEKLDKSGLIDDEKFARAWVNDRRLFKATSLRRLTQELRQKRISDDIISRVLADDDTDELAVLRSMVGKKRQLSRYHDDMKLMQYLVRQGFSYDDIKTVLRVEITGD